MELPDHRKAAEFLAKYGLRGVLDRKASDKEHTMLDPRFGKVGCGAIP
jgi:hypothetical protein